MDLEQIAASAGRRRRYAHGATEVQEVRHAPTRTNGLCVTRASVAGRQTHIWVGRQSVGRWRARNVSVLLRCVLHMSARLGHEGGCSWVMRREDVWQELCRACVQSRNAPGERAGRRRAWCVRGQEARRRARRCEMHKRVHSWRCAGSTCGLERCKERARAGDALGEKGGGVHAWRRLLGKKRSLYVALIEWAGCRRLSAHSAG